MCNHYRNHPDEISAWREYIGWSLDKPDVETTTDVWPKRQGLVIRKSDGAHIADSMAWGVPTTVPGKKPGTKLNKYVTNVRNLASPFWRSMLVRPEARCLVPFSTFAEPKIGEGRAEHWFNVTGAPVSAFAGIWRPSEAGNVYAFLTCEPNPLVAPLHPKAMPVILHPEDYDRWLDGADAASLAVPFPSQLMSVA